VFVFVVESILNEKIVTLDSREEDEV